MIRLLTPQNPGSQSWNLIEKFFVAYRKKNSIGFFWDFFYSKGKNLHNYRYKLVFFSIFNTRFIKNCHLSSLISYNSKILVPVRGRLKYFRLVTSAISFLNRQKVKIWTKNFTIQSLSLLSNMEKLSLRSAIKLISYERSSNWSSSKKR